MEPRKKMSDTADIISISTQDGKAAASLTCIILEKEGLHVGIIPSLKLTARSKSGEADLHKHLDMVMDSFFSFYNSIEKLANELKRLGWNQSKHYDPSLLTDKENVFLSPSEFTIPSGMLSPETKIEREEKRLQLV